MSNKTNFLIYGHGAYHYQLRIFCNDILVDEVVIENGDKTALIKTKSMYHEDGNFQYRFEFTLLSKSNVPLMLWHVLHNDHPMSFYVDTLNYTDIGWLKNRLWTNGKAHIYPGQPMTMHLSFRGGNVAMDNQFQLKNIKELKKVKFDIFDEGDDAHLGNLPTEETHFVAVMKNKDLIIKKYENEQEIVAKFCYTEQMIKEYAYVSEFMRFVERACMMVHLQNSAPEYYNQYKI